MMSVVVFLLVIQMSKMRVAVDVSRVVLSMRMKTDSLPS